MPQNTLICIIFDTHLDSPLRPSQSLHDLIFCSAIPIMISINKASVPGVVQLLSELLSSPMSCASSQSAPLLCHFFRIVIFMPGIFATTECPVHVIVAGRSHFSIGTSIAVQIGSFGNEKGIGASPPSSAPLYTSLRSVHGFLYGQWRLQKRSTHLHLRRIILQVFPQIWFMHAGLTRLI